MGAATAHRGGSVTTNTLVWIGIVFCISQSAIFSGLNLAVFGISRLRLEIEASGGSAAASRVLELRKRSNMTLTTILWGNVAVNVLLTLLSKSVLAGGAAFLFSTFVITFAGEILPQAYFSRNAMRMASLLSPVLVFYQRLLYPVTKPSGMLLDWWLGPEGIPYFRERDFREVIKRHIQAAETDLERVEGLGALNFLELDDVAVAEEGEPVDAGSVIELPATIDLPVFPPIERSPTDPFLSKVHDSGKKWVILTDPQGVPRLVLDADGFLRGALLDSGSFNPYAYCHRPIVVTDPGAKLGEVLSNLGVEARSPDDDVIDLDIVLVWGAEKRVITGADVLGRLMRGIASRKETPRI